jgi:hypothetical protein
MQSRSVWGHGKATRPDRRSPVVRAGNVCLRAHKKQTGLCATAMYRRPVRLAACLLVRVAVTGVICQGASSCAWSAPVCWPGRRLAGEHRLVGLARRPLPPLPRYPGRLVGRLVGHQPRLVRVAGRSPGAPGRLVAWSPVRSVKCPLGYAHADAAKIAKKCVRMVVNHFWTWFNTDTTSKDSSS